MAERQRVRWVVGAGGLLGRSILARASESSAVHRSTVPWQDPEAAVETLRRDAALLLSRYREVELLWCAGSGVIATGSEALAAEERLLERFVEALIDLLSQHPDSVLRFFLASSAGGVYAAASDPPFTEHSATKSLSPYGDSKLAAERATQRLSEHGVSVLVGRIANLYGPGQDMSKPQGLITQLCRAHLQRSPLLIYVPLDTARDYIFVRDAAAMIVAAMDELAAEPRGAHTVKIIASQSATTMASVIGELHRVTKRRPPIVLGSAPSSRFQSRDLRFRSVVWPHLQAHVTTSFPSGIALTLESVAAALRTSAVGH